MGVNVSMQLDVGQAAFISQGLTFPAESLDETVYLLKKYTFNAKSQLHKKPN